MEIEVGGQNLTKFLLCSILEYEETGNTLFKNFCEFRDDIKDLIMKKHF